MALNDSSISFQKEIRFPAEHPFLLFIFVYNEGEKLSRQLSKIPPIHLRGFDIMIGDDGSTDDSITSDLLDRFHVRGVIRLPQNMGLSANIKAGLSWYLQESQYRGLIMMNGNDRDDPEALPRFIHALEEGYDYVQGSRFMKGGKEENTPAIRYWGIRLLHAPYFHWQRVVG